MTSDINYRMFRYNSGYEKKKTLTSSNKQ
ncbi:hypothetical protein [Ignavibacterium album]|nr:hypothetical protein [Ignavibacterium album]